MKINYRITLRSRSTFQNLESTMWLAKLGKGMLFSVEQAFVGRDERQAPLKMLAWEATEITEQQGILIYFIFNMIECDRSKWLARRKVDQSTPQMQSIWTLLIDKLLYRALLKFKENVEKMLYLVMLTAHLSVTLKCSTRCKHKVVSLQFIPTWWSIQLILIPANFFWDISVRFLSWECWDFLRRHDHFRRFPKTSEVCFHLQFHFKNQRSQGRYCHLFILHMVFVPYMGLS